MSTYLSSLSYEICWGFEYLPLSAHINVKLGLKPPFKLGMGNPLSHSIGSSSLSPNTRNLLEQIII